MKEQIIELRKKGYSYDEISKELNVSKSVVSFHLKKNGMNQPINNKGLKTDDAVIDNIKKLNDGVLSKKEIAIKLGISYATVKRYTDKNTKKTLTNDEIKNKKYNNHKNWRLGIKIKAIKYLGGKCVKCGYKKCVAALDLHHKIQTEKEFVISGSNLKSFDKLIPELDKCEILCSNCHREYHNPNLIDLI